MADLSYRASLKNPRVEEVVDLLVHRPLGYVVARAAGALGWSPDALTVASMVAGLAAAAAFAWPPWTGAAAHRVAGGALLVASAVLDCSDGQLARMRGGGTRYGRMLDGAVDAVVQLAVVPAVVAQMVARRGGIATAGTAAWLGVALVAALSGVRHTTLYDHYKNVYARNTSPRAPDCDDAADVEAEWRALQARGPVGLGARFRFGFYRLHLRLVAGTTRAVDPWLPARFALMPAYDPARAARYRALNDGLMRAWSFYGIGTHIFALAVCCALDRLEWYLALRAGVANAALFVLVPAQRRASRAFFGPRAAGAPAAVAGT